jgi:hypothetical protein
VGPHCLPPVGRQVDEQHILDENAAHRIAPMISSARNDSAESCSAKGMTMTGTRSRDNTSIGTSTRSTNRS